MRKFLKEWRWVILAGVLILLLGFFLRFYHLTLLPVFVDEAIYIRWSQVMNAEPTLRFLPLSDGKQPLFMWILMFFVNRLTDPLFAGRVLSVVSGLGTMVGIFALSFLLFKNKLISLVASCLYALSPYTFFFDRMALVDSLMTMFGVWILFFGVLTAQSLRLDYAMIAGFFLGAALLTKSTAIFFVFLLPLAWIVSGRKLKEVFKFIFLLVATYLIVFLLYNIQRLGPNFNLLASRTKDYIFPLSHLWQNPKDPFIFHFDRALEWLWAMGPWPIFILGAVGLIFNFKKYFKEELLLLAWWLMPTLIQSEFAKVFTARYELFTVPFLLALAATSFLIRKKAIRLISVGGLIVFAFFSLQFNYFLLTNPEKANLPRSEKSGYLEEWTAGTGIKEIADYLEKEEAKKERKIVVGTEGFFGTLPDGLQMYLAKTPQITVIGVGIDIKEVPQSLIESKRAGNRTFLVVNKSRLLGDAKKLGLDLVAEYPKSPRPKNIKEYLTKGPQEFLYFFELK